MKPGYDDGYPAHRPGIYLMTGGGKRCWEGEARQAMANRKTYWVQYILNRWMVRHNGASLSTHVTKDAAITAGVKVAKANQPSELFICKMNGQIEDRRTYGDDPFPPRG